jgi:hypothetical protein
MVVGIVGAAILVAGMVGVFAYERNVAPPPTGTSTDGGAGGGAIPQPASASGTTSVGQATTTAVHVNATRASFANFTVSWTPGQTSSDTLQVNVTGPSGEKATQSGNGGRIVLSIPVPAGASPTGDWNVTIAFVSAALAGPVTPPVNPPVSPPAGTDGSVSWKLDAQLT